MPMITCPKEEINNTHSSMIVEEVGNTYFSHNNQWFAINESYIRYECKKENDLKVGTNVRRCLKSGQWSGFAPYCVQPCNETITGWSK